MTRQNWFESNPRKAKWLVFFLCLTGIEIVIRAFAWAGYLPYETYQTDARPLFWAYTDPVVGRWRHPNVTYRHRVKCIDAVYTTNSIGARDPERALSSNGAERVVMLGDSYLEGFGVNHGERASDILEQMTGMEHLNFGTSDFGTIQEWLTYEHIARAYDHTKVVLYVLPENDFKDNNPDNEHGNIYRPFLKETGTGYEVYYEVEFEQRYTGIISIPQVIKNTVDNSVYTANLLRWTARLVKDGYRESVTDEPTSHYAGYSQQGLDIMLFALGRVADLAGDRPVYVVTLPATTDLNFAVEYGTESQLMVDLEQFADSRTNVHIVDLLPYFLQDARETGRAFRDYTLGCDAHWSGVGHRVAAETLFKEIHAKTPLSR